MTSAKVDPETYEIRSGCGRLTVQFRWRGDRFSHQILLGDKMIASSVEGDPEQPWPPSPPVQQISLEELGDKWVVLGVGAAGSSHWSVAVEPFQESAIRFDWACRTGDTGSQLMTTYDRLAEGWAIEPADNARQVDSNSLRRIHPADHRGPTWQWTYRIVPTDSDR